MAGIKNMNGSGKKKLCAFIGCLFALAFILLIYTPANVDPGNTNWVINGGGDNLQHYLGWRFFRSSGWNRYLLFMQNLNYPAGTSVIVTDSNPLFCLIFKLLRDFIPGQFQFSGIWIVSSYVLLAFFSSLILWKLTGKIIFTIAGTVMAVLNPVILQRALIHDTLTAHWIILASIWLFLNNNKKWNLPGWFILTGITLLVHFYFIPMIAFVLVLQCIRMGKQHKSFFSIITVPVVFSLSLLLGYYLFGYSHILPQSGSFGELSMNLNAFFNPDSIPALIKPREILSLQYEGFNYWGLGLFGLILLGIIVGRKTFYDRISLYIVPAILLVLLAASNTGYFDTRLIYQVHLPEWLYSLLSIFRSSGRLVWCLYYLVLFSALSVISEKSDMKSIFNSLVIACVVLQIIDMQAFIRQCADRFRNPANQIAEISGTIIGEIPDITAHLFSSEGNSRTVDAFALYAADHNMTFNKSADARGIERIYGGDVIVPEELTCSQLRTDSVYLYFSNINFPEELAKCEGFELIEFDDMKMVRPR